MYNAALDSTMDPNGSPDLFTKKAEEFFTTLNLPLFTDVLQAEVFVRALDGMADTLIMSMQQNDTTYSPETVLLLGSSLGEAFRIVFGGRWLYSEKQGRWVIACKDGGGNPAELNVFN